MLDDTVSELLTNESFVNWVRSGDASKNQYWIDWLSKNPEKKKAFQEAQQLIRSMGYEDVYKMKPNESEDLHYLLRGRYTNSQPKRPQARYWLSGVAASILLILGLTAYYGFYKKVEKVENQACELVERSTAYGTKLTVSLPDGSVVKLNSGSKLSFQKPFGPDTREIALTGEAYFKVMEDASRPFIVKTNGVETTVLGTTFNISAYEGDDQVNVALVTGMVKININQPSQKVEKILNPKEMMTFSRALVEVTVRTFEVDRVIGWKDQVIYFDKESLSGIIDRLEKWYGVEVTVNNPNGRRWNYTGKFEKKSLEHVLLRMSYTEGFTYRIENNNVSINIK